MVKKKILDRFGTVVLFSFLITAVAIPLFDIYSMNSGVFGTAHDYLNGNYTAGWWNIFFNIGLFVMGIIAVSYYIFSKKHDKSEALAVFLVPYISWIFGVADVMFFWIRGKAVPETLPWLMSSKPIADIALFMGETTVTSNSLLFSSLLGTVVAVSVAYILKKKF